MIINGVCEKCRELQGTANWWRPNYRTTQLLNTYKYSLFFAFHQTWKQFENNLSMTKVFGRLMVKSRWSRWSCREWLQCCFGDVSVYAIRRYESCIITESFTLLTVYLYLYVFSRWSSTMRSRACQGQGGLLGSVNHRLLKIHSTHISLTCTGSSVPA